VGSVYRRGFAWLLYDIKVVLGPWDFSVAGMAVMMIIIITTEVYIVQSRARAAHAMTEKSFRFET
jgi:hypothetical protein